MEKIKKNGWNMLDSYKEGQIIYGRDEEIASISESIQYNVQTFLYGKSGIGKTSLIQAGVFPELRKAHYFPVIIRLALYDKKESLNSIVKRLIFEEADQNSPEIRKYPLAHNVIDDSDVSEVPLYEFFSKVRFEDEEHHPYIPVLIFDQFEETINNEDFWQRTVDFIKNDLYDLMDNSNVVHGEALSYTNYRIVISMREDYLYCLEDIIDRFSLWELRYNRFRIKALDDAKAAEVIRKTSGVAGLESGNEDKIVDTIIKIVKLSNSTRFTEINTALLSLICSLLYDKSENECIRYKDLRNINLYLRSYYDEICDDIGSKATHYLESHLLTKDGRRSSMDESEAVNSGKISQESLDNLVEKRLLRRIKIDSTSNRYEYIHDLFAKMVYKRLQEDKSRWFYPELRTLSRKEDRSSFLRKFTVTSLVALCICCVMLAYHSITFHNTWIFWDFSCRVNLLYYIPFGISVYLLSLVTKRLHDVNKTGWLCLIIPFSVLLININHFPIFTENTIIHVIAKLLGYLQIIYLIYLCLRPSIKNTKPHGFSREYENLFNMAPISNLVFAKSLSIELVWWTACCCMTDMFLSSYSNYEFWSFFHIEQKTIFLDKFGLTTSLPAVISLLPLIISFSPALRARVKSLGYPIWISYIPYFNLLLLIEGLFSDRFLKKVKLICARNRNLQDSDNIFAEINDDFTIDENILFRNQVNNSLSAMTRFLLILVPFYGLIRGFDKKEKIGIRAASIGLGFVNSLLLLSYFLYSLIVEDYLHPIEKIMGVLAFVSLFMNPIGIIMIGRDERKIIVCLINECSISQIAKELVVQPSALKKDINRMEKEGILLRIEENGQVSWKVMKEK